MMFIIISLLSHLNMYSSVLINEKKGTDIVKELPEQEIALTEDLMREHSALNRVLLIYEEIIKRMEQNESSVKSLEQSITIILDFIENYHEKLEESYIFPLFEKNKKHVPLVKTLLKQHRSGRDVTTKLKNLADKHKIMDKKTKKMVVTLLKKFIRMYRPHAAREDTILFPMIRSLMSQKEFEELGEKFEDLEHELFGKEGFFGILKRIENIEKDLGIYSLEQFTPN